MRDDDGAAKATSAVGSRRILSRLAANLHSSRAAVGRLAKRTGIATRPSGRSLTRRLLLPGLVGFLTAGALVAFLLSRVQTTSLLGTVCWTTPVAFVLSRVQTISALYVLYIGASLVIGAVCWTTLVWMVYAWRNPAAFDETRLPTEDLDTHQSFSLIVPARHEEEVLESTLSRLVQTEHPAFEVLVVVGTDDPLTQEAAERVAAAHPDRVKLIVDHSWPKNKPKALNAALPFCRGEITGVFDAEDDVHPALIRGVDQCFQRTGADVVQAGVQLTNLRSSWYAVRNALEYYFWFRSRLHFHARAGFIPLGGNTVFIRTNVLREVGGWDPECLAEDCELGVRLSSFGAKTVVFYEPELVTREETPPTLGAFVRQRTRWNQGYLQTLSRKYWRNLPLKQRALGLYTLAMPYLMAVAWVMIPAAIVTAIVVKAPVPVTLISFLPAFPMLAVLAVEAAGLGELCRSLGERASLRDYARLVLGLPIYLAVLAFAAARAVIREARGVRGWEKTAHFGLHRPRPDRQGKSAFRERPTLPAELETLAADTSTVFSRAGAGAMSRGPAEADPVGTVLVGASAPGTARDGLAAGHLAALSTGGPSWAGDGQTEHNGSGAIGDLGARTAGEPLWIRLRMGPLNGSEVPTPAEARLIDRAGWNGSRAKGLGAFLGRFRASRADVAVQLSLLACVGLVQVVNLLHWPGSFFDEGTYVANAWAVQTHGALSNYTYGYGHPPLGWLILSLWTWASGAFGNTIYSVAVGRELMAAISIISCSLLYTLARRLGIGRPFAVATVVVFALSPLGLYFHRPVLIDNVAIAWALAAFVLALSPKRRLWTFAASGACFAASVLSKETALILLPALLLAAAQNFDRRTRRYCLTLLASFLGLTSLGYPLYAALKGELLPGPGHVSLVGEAVIQLLTRKGTGSVFDPHSQGYGIVHVWLHLDPWLLGAALFLSPIALRGRTTRAAALACLVQFAVILRPGYLPFMYVIGLLPFAAIVVGGTAEVLWRRARESPQHSATRHASSAASLRAARGWRAIVTRASAYLAPVARRGAVAGLALLVTVFAFVVGPRWARTDWQAMTLKLDGPERAAEQWLVRNVDHSKRILVSDDFWVYLIEHGWDAHPVRGGFYSRTVVFYWNFDDDPAVQRRFPQGWRNFDYIVSTQGMRNDISQVPKTAQALVHSRLVVSFGRGAYVAGSCRGCTQRIEVRAIDRGQASAPVAPTRPTIAQRP